MAASLTFIFPEMVFVVRFVEFTFKALVELPKLPDVLLRDSLPVLLVLTVAIPEMLPLAVFRLIEFVEVVLPSVVPFNVMLPVPLPLLLVSITMVEAVDKVGVTFTEVADCKLNEFWLFVVAAEIVIGKAPVPGLKPTLLRKADPGEFTAKLTASRLRGVELLPMVAEFATLGVAVVNVTDSA